MNAIYDVLAVFWKELQVIVRDRGSLALLFLLPLLLSTLMGGANVAMEGTFEDTSILVDVCLVNDDSGDFGREVAKAVQDIDELHVETLDAVTEAEQQVAQGEVVAAIVIPTDFSQKINAYEPTSVEVMVDPAEVESASIVTGIMNQVVDEVIIWGEVSYGIRAVLDASGLLTDVNPEQRRAIEAQNLGVVMTRLNEMRENPIIAVNSEDLQGEEIVSGFNVFFAYLFPAFTVMFIFFVVATCARSILIERESGTLRRLVAAPISGGAVIIGKTMAYMLIPCLQTVVLLGVATLFFNVPLGQSPVALVVLTLIVALVASAMGLLVATLAKTANQADNIGTFFVGFVLGAIGGAIPLTGKPIARMGGPISFVSKLTPHAHAIEGYYKLMAENATFVDLLPEMGILLAMAVLFFVVAMRRFRFE